MLEVREGEKLTSCLLLLTSVINLISSGEINIKIMMPKMRYLGKTADRRDITLRLPIVFISQLRTTSLANPTVINLVTSLKWPLRNCIKGLVLIRLI